MDSLEELSVFVILIRLQIYSFQSRIWYKLGPGQNLKRGPPTFTSQYTLVNPNPRKPKQES